MIGSDPGTLAFIAQAISGTAGAAGAYSQSQAMAGQAGFEKRAAHQNAAFADERAEDALQRGGKAAAEHMRRTAELQGSQRAAYAGQGVDVSAGSAADVISDTATLGARDAETIRQNAYREAWGHRVDAANLRTRGNLAGIAGKGQARQTLLTGGMGAIRDVAYGAYLYRRENPGSPASDGAPAPMSKFDSADQNRLRRRNPFYDPRGDGGLA
jgi:hypothetical protein